MRTPLLPPTSSRVAAWPLLVAAFALLVGPLAGEWGHLTLHGGAELHGVADSRGASGSHDLPGRAEGHLECEAWKVSAGHEEHSDEQFERSEPAHHEHHGLCSGHSSLSGAESSEAKSMVAAATSVAAAESASAAEGPAVLTPRPRGPPHRV